MCVIGVSQVDHDIAATCQVYPAILVGRVMDPAQWKLFLVSVSSPTPFLGVAGPSPAMLVDLRQSKYALLSC